jgi:hypothetical protein
LQTTRTRVFSKTAFGRTNRSIVDVTLPANTSFWTYWIGVDQAATEHMQRFAETLSAVGQSISKHPLVQLGFGLIKEIPAFSTTSTVNYRFADAQNAQAFLAGRPYSFYKFKAASNISSDFALVTGYPHDVTLCFDNDSPGNGHDIEVRVVAFMIKKRLAIDK